MFLLIPWRVDVPQERWPVMNWLIILAMICVFTVQVADLVEYAVGSDPSAGAQTEIPGITGALKLNGWYVKGLLGYMWLHGSLFHLLGNMLFLWIFGNAVCAKVGNLRYLCLYILFGVAAGIAHLVFTSQTAIGASGAINGVVGMYLVLFYENEITCLFAAWLIVPYVRWFTVSGIWMILFWLFWDLVGAVAGGAGVAYFAHLGGFAAGFGTAWLMCATGWIRMERYEKSLLQMWQQRRARAQEIALNAEYLRSGLAPSGARQASGATATVSAQSRESTSSPARGRENPSGDPLLGTFIHTTCTCGRRVMVSQQYAGKIIRCSECGQIITIPLQSSPPSATAAQRETTRSVPAPMQHDHIRFACHCGRNINVPARYAGRFGKCPQCGARLRIPETSDEQRTER